MLTELGRSLPAVRVLSGDAEAIPLPDSSVDAVVAGNAMHWFDMAVSGPETARVLAPGGILAGLWIPDQHAYLLPDVERGEEFRGAVPRDAMATIAERGCICSPSRRASPSSPTSRRPGEEQVVLARRLPQRRPPRTRDLDQPEGPQAGLVPGGQPTHLARHGLRRRPPHGRRGRLTAGHRSRRSDGRSGEFGAGICDVSTAVWSSCSAADGPKQPVPRKWTVLVPERAHVRRAARYPGNSMKNGGRWPPGYGSPSSTRGGGFR